MPSPLLCTWNDTQLLVERLTDAVGHDWVQHRYPGRDGTEVESMGRRPRDFRAELVFMGATWVDDAWAFIQSVEDPEGAAGTFTHPWWGSMSAVIDQVDVTHVDRQTGAAKVTAHILEAVVTPFAFAATSTLSSAIASTDVAIAGASAAVAGLATE